MPITPSGVLSLPLQYLKNLIAASSTFQTVCGVEDAAAAAACVLLFWADEKIAEAELEAIANDETPETHERMPRAVVRHLPGLEHQRSSTTGWVSTGPLHLMFEFPAHTDHDTAGADRQAGIDFQNQIGAILSEMRTLVTTDPGAGPYLAVTGFDLVTLGEIDPDDCGGVHAWLAEFIVHHEGN